MTSPKWRPIQDLPTTWHELADDNLPALAEIWEEQREHLEKLDAVKEFNSRLQRQWAIETGMIEGLYTIDRGTTQLLINEGIQASLISHAATDKPVEAILPMLKDQEDVVQGLFDFVAQRRSLSCSYIKELHQALTAHQATVEVYDSQGYRRQVALSRGAWKILPNNPTRFDGTTHEYCPPEQVSSEMDRLVSMHLDHEANGVMPEVEAAWLHHRFTQIHPFQDGNGRVARALGTLVFLRRGWFPLVVVSDQHRDEYIRALEQADHGDLRTLISLFARLQKQAFRGALSISEDLIATQRSLDAMIESAAARLRDRNRPMDTEKRLVFNVCSRLETIAGERLNEVRNDLEVQITGIDNSYQISVEQSDENKGHWFWNQVVEMAKHHGYFADLRTYHRWFRLRVRKVGEYQSEIVISFHPLGTTFSGIMAASAFVEHRVLNDDLGGATLDGPYPCCDETFEFSYRQEAETVMVRFERWLNEAILAGLDHWRRSI
ncbi:MAG: Fic family protein [Candidatus Hydrogenedentota bacterium]